MQWYLICHIFEWKMKWVLRSEYESYEILFFNVMSIGGSVACRDGTVHFSQLGDDMWWYHGYLEIILVASIAWLIDWVMFYVIFCAPCGTGYMRCMFHIDEDMIPYLQWAPPPQTENTDSGKL